MSVAGGIDALLARARQQPTRRDRFVVSLTLGCLAATMTIRESVTVHWPRDWWPRDFGQVWFAARAILHGRDPYPLVGPDLEFDWGSPLVYPLPAALVGIPFTPFPEPAASALFCFVGATCFAWALMEHGYGTLFGFFSVAVREAASAAQWSMLVASTYVLGSLSWVLIAKPTIGFALFIARPRRTAVIGGLVLAALAFIIVPHWIPEWIASVHLYEAMGAPERPYRTIIGFPGGPLTLLCLLRWRRPEARMTAALVCAPITLMAYEMVPLLLVPRTFWEAAILVLLSYVRHYLSLVLTPMPWTHHGMEVVAGRLFVLLMYFPATVLILARPNEGVVPLWLEKRIAAWPEWLRGRAHSGALHAEA
jgi:hypothetical protein